MDPPPPPTTRKWRNCFISQSLFIRHEIILFHHGNNIYKES
jgi:hypothetical protein